MGECYFDNLQFSSTQHRDPKSATVLLAVLVVSVGERQNEISQREQIKYILSSLTDLIPLSMYLTSCEMKQLNCRKFSLLIVGGSSSVSVHFISMSNVPPKY